MFCPPSVSYPVGRSVLAGVLILLFWLGALMAVGAWLWLLPFLAHPWYTAMGAGACLLSALWLLHHWSGLPVGKLCFESGAWSLDVAGDAQHQGCVRPALDFQGLLLLRWSGNPATSKGVVWLWLERSHAPHLWDALRRAVYSRADPDGLAGAQEPSAIP